MGVLTNPKHERFARLLFQGEGVREAYEMAGFAYDEGNAYRLKNDDRIVQRLEELGEDAAKVACLDKSYVLQGLMQVVEQSLIKRELTDKKGKPLGVFVYDSAGANRALELLGKTEGLEMFTDKSKNSQIPQTAEELLAVAEKLPPAEREKLLSLAKPTDPEPEKPLTPSLKVVNSDGKVGQS